MFETLTKAFDAILDLRQSSNEIIQLTYAACLYPDPEIIDEIDDLKEEIRRVVDRLERRVLEAENLTIRQRMFFIHFLAVITEISDTSNDMAQTVRLMGVSENRVHRALLRGNEESDVTIRRIRLHRGSPMIGETVGESLFRHGISCFLIKRDGCYNFEIRPTHRLQANDVLIVQGTKENIELLLTGRNGSHTDR